MSKKLLFSCIPHKDIRKQDQMSQIIRYVFIEKNQDNKPIKLRIEESLLGFCLLNDHSVFF